AGGGGDGVFEHGVAVLDHAVVVAGHVDRRVHPIQHPTAAKADQPDGGGAHQPSRPDRRDHVRRVAAGADGDHDVTRVQQVGQLLGEDLLVGGVVRPGGQQGDVVGEGGDPQTGAALDDGRLGEVAGKVSGVRRAATVADDVDVTAVRVSVEDDADHPLDGVDRNPAQNGT